jgi:hypothetical protein
MRAGGQTERQTDSTKLIVAFRNFAGVFTSLVKIRADVAIFAIWESLKL